MSKDMDSIKENLVRRYLATCDECKKFKYYPHAFRSMIASGEDIIEVTKKLIDSGAAGTSGFTRLFEADRLDLSVERIIYEPQFKVLFSDEVLRAAYDRLQEYGYKGLDELERP